MMERSPLRSHTSEQANSVHEETNYQKCAVCCEKMTEEQECLLLSECHHKFHSNCVETLLSSSSECPTCKRPCILSELRRVDNFPQSQDGEKSKSAYRGRPRGASNAPGRHFTRSQAKNLFSDSQPPSQNASANLLIVSPSEPLKRTTLIILVQVVKIGGIKDLIIVMQM